MTSQNRSFGEVSIDIVSHVRHALNILLESHWATVYDGVERYSKFGNFWIFVPRRSEDRAVCEQFMKLFAKISLSWEQITLIAKFINCSGTNIQTANSVPFCFGHFFDYFVCLCTVCTQVEQNR